MGSINRYANQGVEFSWIRGYLEKGEDFWQDNNLGSHMLKNFKYFLADAEIEKKQVPTAFGRKAMELGPDSISLWGVAICNLSYTSQFAWWVNNVKFDVLYEEDELKELVRSTEIDASKTTITHVVSAFKNIFYTNTILGETIGLGDADVIDNGKTRKLKSIIRHRWAEPIPEVILYSLYKFAEACGGLYQFSLSYLMDETIERDGVSPTTIFGLDRDTMIGLLNGLAINYADYISASIVMDLETITLRSDKTSQDIPQLL